MDAINWNDIADKIRAGNFGEISDSVWREIADKVEPKKRGRKPRAVPEYREDWSLEDMPKTDKLNLSVMLKYELLRSEKVRSKKAFELIADNLDACGKPDLNCPKVSMTAGNVERIVYAWKNMEKELNKMMQEEMRLEK